ncbi:MAG TPA: lipid II flippase MurJ [Candidatus Limnocylindria bacterium]|nr:lipid II flippase MurJ [Candidatus Limnocylindria bacterium]
MNKWIQRANKKVGVGGAAALLIVISLIGQVLGFLRYKMVNANFDLTGAQSTDAYFAAFKIPDFFFFTLAAGALGVAFMPFLSDHLHKGDRKGVWDLSNSLMNLLAIVMAVVGVVMFVFAEPLIKYIVGPGLAAPGAPPEQLHNAVLIMRFISFNPMLFAISGVLVSVQQVFGRFFFYAMAPLFYNLAQIVAVLLFRDSLGLIGLGVGALLGAILQLFVVFLGLMGANYKWRPKIMWKSPDFRQILRQLPPRSIDQGVDSLNSIVETNLATRLGTGNVSFYENAYILHTTPTLLVGTTIATAAFPRLNERLSQGRPDLFRKEFLQILRAMIWIIMPIVVVCYFARAYFARLIFTNSAPEIAVVFGFFAGAILFRTIYAIVSRWFYAQKDTKTPLYVSLLTIALNIYLAYTLSRPDAYGISGLAMAQSIVAAVEVVILGIVMLVRDRKLFDMRFWGGLVRIASVTGFSVLTAFIMISLLPLNISDRGIVTLGVKLGVISLVTFLVHLTISLMLGLEEAKPIIERTKRFILRPIKITY